MKASIVVLFSLLSILFSNVSASYSMNSISAKCTKKKLAVAPSPLSLRKMMRFFESQFTQVKFFSDYVKAEEHAIFQSFTEETTNKEDIHLPMEKLCKKYGYPIEKYEVCTKDGYINTMFRMPNDGPTVMLVHGAAGSSEDFITAGPEDGMAYALHRAGYDVFLLNCRGNKFSQKHKTLTPECTEYWDFSFNEVGKYDIPAAIDFIIEKTGCDSVALIGWSQGSTSSFVMASECPEYNDKVYIMISLSPVVYMTHCASPILQYIALGEDKAYLFLEGVGYSNFAPSNVLTKSLVQIFCAPNPVSKIACSSVITLMVGYDGCHANLTALPVEFGHNPSGCSTKAVIHYSQEINSGKFGPFDYGKKKNKQVYGCEEPPEYPLEKVTCPVALFYSNRDWFANVTDVNRLKKKLPNVVKDYCIDRYSHLDYVWSNDVSTTVTSKILKLLKKYAPSQSDEDC